MPERERKNKNKKIQPTLMWVSHVGIGYGGDVFQIAHARPNLAS